MCTVQKVLEALGPDGHGNLLLVGILLRILLGNRQPRQLDGHHMDGLDVRRAPSLGDLHALRAAATDAGTTLDAVMQDSDDKQNAFLEAWQQKCG